MPRRRASASEAKAAAPSHSALRPNARLRFSYIWNSICISILTLHLTKSCSLDDGNLFLANPIKFFLIVIMCKLLFLSKLCLLQLCLSLLLLLFHLLLLLLHLLILYLFLPFF